MTHHPPFIGIDIGGTNIKAALFEPLTGTCVERKTAPTRDGDTVEGQPAWAVAVRTLVEEFEKVHAGGQRLAVGISAPGLAAKDGACISWMPGRMHGIEGFQWREFLERPAVVLNDAHAAILGEIWQGAAAGAQDALMLTLGTGVGGAVVSGGRLLTGHIGRAGHLGHITVDQHGAPGITGTPGNLEDAIGNSTISRRTGGMYTSTRDLLQAVKAGEPEAIAWWDASVYALAVGVTSLINCFDPEVVILGGGIAAGAGDMLMTPLGWHLDRVEWRPGGHRVRVVLATLGEWAGAAGAARRASKPVPQA